MSTTISAREKIFLSVPFILFYLLLGVMNYLRGSEFVIDNTMSILFIGIVFLLAEWLMIGRMGYAFFLLALLIHNMGTFGWYEMSHGIIAYDNFVHIVGAAVTAWILFNFILRKLEIRKGKREKTFINEHKAIFFFLVLASVSLLGVGVELMEFTGHFVLGEGEGLFFTGAGDGGILAWQYIDTMTDIIVNILGALIGTLAYYFSYYRHHA